MANQKQDSNVISFKDTVLQLQQLNKTAKEQEKQATKMTDLEKMVVVLDAHGEKTLIKEEEVIEKQTKMMEEDAKETKKFQEKTVSSLKDITSVLTSISKTIEAAVAGGIAGSAKVTPSQSQGTTLTEDQEESARAEADSDKKKEFLIDKVIQGIAGLKTVSEKGFSKMSDTFKEGQKEGGGILGGLSSLFGKGKDLAGGGLKGMARGGLNMLSKAGPVAGAVGIGLAGLNVVNDVMGNVDKSNEIEENVKSGALTRSEGNVLQGESLGDTAGTAAGATIGGIAGSALGPLGTAAGMWLGSKVGGWVGGKAGKYGVKAYQGIKSMLGFGESKDQEQAKMTPEQKLMSQYTSGEINEDEYNKKLKLQVDGGSQPTPETPPVASATKAEVAPAVKESVIEAVPTQEPSKAEGTGVWDKIKSGAGKAAMIAMPAAGLAYMGGKAVAGKASEWGKGISDWFGGTKVGKAWGERGVGVDANVSPEMLVGSKEQMKETQSSDGKSSLDYNQGVTVEKSALGSAWLGKLFASKGTETENFVATSEKSNEKGTTGADFLGSRKNGGWFGKDQYTITDPNTGAPLSVDKDTYMKAKGIAQKGGDATAIGGFLPKVSTDANAKGDALHTSSVAAEDAKENVSKQSGGNAVVNAPTVVNNTTNSTNTMRSPIKNEEGSVNRYLRSRYGMI